jgi:hypothetical protein
LNYLFYPFKKGFPIQHDNAAAFKALDLEISSYPDHSPFVIAAGMGFSGLYDISDSVFC